MKPEQSKPLPQHEGSEPSPAFEQAMEAPAKFSSNKEAAKALADELEKIASGLKLSVDELLKQAEHSVTFREEYIQALQLARQIAYFNRK